MARLIALLQLNPTVGALGFNMDRIITMANIAAENGATVAVTTELAVSGYPPRDLLLQEDFVHRCERVAYEMAEHAPIPILVGTPLSSEPRNRPGNGVIRVGPSDAREVTRKQLLPTYDVFDEARYFSPNDQPGIVRSIGGLNLGVTVCEDAWQHAGLVPSDYDSDPIQQLAGWAGQGMELEATLNLSSSPYHSTKQGARVKVVRACAATLGHPFLLANQVGGNDDLLFDGRSLAAWPDGTIVQAPGWCEGILIVDLDDAEATKWLPQATGTPHDGCQCAPQIVKEGLPQQPEASSDLLCAVTTGLRDYCRKSGISKLVLGMSGGIDSAVAAAVAVRALGPGQVVGISMPSRHSSQHSRDDAKATAEALGMEYLVMPIEQMHQSTESTLNSELSEGHPVAAENVQARLRGLIVMGIANGRGAMAIATGNKSELGQGYCTLYGDMAGGYAPLGDLWKTEVYALAREINAQALTPLQGQPKAAPRTESTLTKPPSAELAPNQTDQDTLPPYETLDAILKGHIEENLSESELIANGHDAYTVRTVIQRLAKTEHKRWQMPPAPRVSRRAFGQGWRQPMAANHNWH